VDTCQVVAKVLIGVGIVVALVGIVIIATGGPSKSLLGLTIMGMSTASLFVGVGLTFLHRFTVDDD